MQKPKTYFSRNVRDGQLVVYSWNQENFQIDMVCPDGTCSCIDQFFSLDKAIEYVENY